MLSELYLYGTAQTADEGKVIKKAKKVYFLENLQQYVVVYNSLRDVPVMSLESIDSFIFYKLSKTDVKIYFRVNPVVTKALVQQDENSQKDLLNLSIKGTILYDILKCNEQGIKHFQNIIKSIYGVILTDYDVAIMKNKIIPLSASVYTEILK